MKVLSSYTLSIILCIVLSLSMIGMITVDHFSVIVDENIARISGMEQSTNFQTMEEKISQINKEAESNNLIKYSKSEAIDLIIKYADYLLTTYNAKAETDYPEDTGNIISLNVTFDTSFATAGDFLTVIGDMLKMKSPIVLVNNVDFVLSTDSQTNKPNAYKIGIKADLIQPYIAGDGNNGKQ